MYQILFVLVFCLFSSIAHSELYRCLLTNGTYQYTDTPCSTSGSTYEPTTNITQYKDIEDVKIKQRFKSSPSTQSTCPHFSSTELRNLRVKDEFKKGLSQDHIKQRFGEPTGTTSSKRKTVFSYKNNNVSRIFRFKDGCLIGWKETWKNKESQISKFRGER